MAEEKKTDDVENDSPEELSKEALEQVQGGITLDNGLKMKREVPTSSITLDNGLTVKRDISTKSKSD